MNHTFKTVIFSTILLLSLSQQSKSTEIFTTTCISVKKTISHSINFISNNQLVDMISFDVDLDKDAASFPLENLFGLKIADKFFLPQGNGRFLKASNLEKLHAEFNKTMGTPFEFSAKDSNSDEILTIRCFAGLKSNIETAKSFEERLIL